MIKKYIGLRKNSNVVSTNGKKELYVMYNVSIQVDTEKLYIIH